MHMLDFLLIENYFQTRLKCDNNRGINDNKKVPFVFKIKYKSRIVHVYGIYNTHKYFTAFKSE